MTVTEIMFNFRAALLAVLPMVEKAGILWRPGEAYDEWDDVASSLYSQLVGSVLSSALHGDYNRELILAAYEVMLPSYRELATIEAHNPALGPGQWVFHAFGTQRTPFDVVDVREVNADGAPRSEEIRSCETAATTFSLKLPDGIIIERIAEYNDNV